MVTTICRLTALSLVAVMVLGCTAGRDLFGKAGTMDLEGQVGAIHLVEGLKASTGVKSVVAAYGFTAAGVTPSVARVVYGGGTSPRSDGTDFRLMIVDAGGQTLWEYTIRNPRRILVERKGIIEEDEIFYVARFPFSARAAQVRVLDRRGKTLAVTEIGPTIRDFCVAVKQDEDCGDFRP